MGILYPFSSKIILSKKIFDKFNLCLSSSKESKKYLKSLGATNVKLLGNIKFSQLENEKTTLNKLPTFKIPLFISYGENEPEGWKHQSISYCNFLTKNDYKYKLIPSKGDNHFTLIDTLANENSNICKEIIKLSK